jgi:3-isopropylmalate dehydrogenase
MILATREGLSWLSEQKGDEALQRGAEAVEAAVVDLLKAGEPLTYDMVGEARAASCSAVGRAVADGVLTRLG